MSNKFKFTQANLKKIKPQINDDTGEKKARSFFTDTETPGLRLSVTKTGSKSFQFRQWSKELQKPVTVTIGRFPNIPLDAARDRVKELSGEVVRGKDLESMRQEKRSEMICNELFESWMTSHGKHKKSAGNDLSTWRRLVAPAFGNKKISSLTSVQVEKWHRGIIETPKSRGKGNYTTSSANSAFRLLRTVFNQGTYILPNPCSCVKELPEQRSERFLDGAELAAFFQAIEQERTTYGDLAPDYFLMCLFTGARSGNVRAMKWSAISDNGVWTVKPSESKNAKPLGFALSDPAREILERRRQEQRDSGLVTPWIFHSDRATTGHIGEARKAWKRICKKAGIQTGGWTKGLRVHDLRHTLGSQLALGGASAPQIKAALGHADGRTTEKYIHMTASHDVANKAAERMQAQVDNEADKVVAIGGRK